MKKFKLVFIGVAIAILAFATTAGADIFEFTTEAAFTAALTSSYNETFATAPTGSPQNYSNGTFSYDISAPGGLYALPLGGPFNAISTTAPTDVLTVELSSGTPNPVTPLGDNSILPLLMELLLLVELP